MKRVRDVMTRRVVTARPDATFKETAFLLHGNHVSGLPVVDQSGRVLGVVSEADLILKEEHGAGRKHAGSLWWGGVGTSTGSPWWIRRRKAEAVAVRDLMTSPAVTIGPDASCARAARVMRENGVKRLPVVNDHGRLVGIVSRADLVQTFLRPDRRIREEIEAALSFGVHPSRGVRLSVTVTGGVVTIRGAVFRKSEIGAIRRLAAEVDGVVDVVLSVDFELDDVRPDEDSVTVGGADTCAR